MISDKHLEELLQIIIPETCNEDIGEIEDKILKEDIHVFSKDFEKKMMSIFKQKERFVKGSTYCGKYTKIKMKYLLVAILLFILSSVTVLAYEPARMALEKMFFSVFDDSLLFHSNVLKEENDDGDVIFLKPTFIPENYILMDEHISPTKTNISLVWIDENENILFYEQRTDQAGELTLSSSGNMPLDITIGDKNGKLIIENDGIKTIFYEENECLFIISGILDENSLIDILLSLQVE